MKGMSFGLWRKEEKMKKDKRNKLGKKKQPKKVEKINKKYSTNKDTISLNCDEFCPGWMTRCKEESNE